MKLWPREATSREEAGNGRSDFSGSLVLLGKLAFYIPKKPPIKVSLLTTGWICFRRESCVRTGMGVRGAVGSVCWVCPGFQLPCWVCWPGEEHKLRKQGGRAPAIPP